MANLTQKRKLFGLLKKMGGVNDTDQLILNRLLESDYTPLSSLIEEAKKARESIPSPLDMKPLERELKRLESLIIGHTTSLISILGRMDEVKEAHSKTKEETAEKIEKLAKELDSFKKISTEFESLKKTFYSLSLGGGSIPLQVSLNGTVANSKYADINIVNVGGSVANNNTTKKTDITIATAGGMSLLAATGAVDGSNTAFTFTSAPSVIFVDGVPKQKTASDGTTNWTGTTSVTLTVAPTYDIYALG